MQPGYKIPRTSSKSNAMPTQLDHNLCQQKYNKLFAEHERTLGTWFAPEAVKILQDKIHRLSRCREELIAENCAQQIIINDKSAVLVASFTEVELTQRLAGRDLAVKLNLIPANRLPEANQAGPAQTPRTSKKHHLNKNRRRRERRRAEGLTLLSNAAQVLEEATALVTEQHPEFVKKDEIIPNTEKSKQTPLQTRADETDEMQMYLDISSITNPTAASEERSQTLTSYWVDDFGDELCHSVTQVGTTQAKPIRNKRKFPIDIDE